MELLFGLLELIVICLQLIHCNNMNDPFIRSKGSHEYCETETFRAQCNLDEVVVMEAAEYGRMSIGKCVLKDYGFVGCQANVLLHMDSVCSGRRECDVRIPDQTLDQMKPCPGDFKTFLKASYQCFQIHQPRCERECVNVTLLPVRSGSGYLSSTSADDGCGGAKCPWLLQALPGQQLNITLLDFDVSKQDITSSPVDTPFGLPTPCHRYATIREVPLKTYKEICGATAREQHVYLSVGNAVQITIEPRPASAHFLFFYKVIGCPDYVAPEYMWAELVDDHVTVTCQSSGRSRQLYCQGNEWVGDLEHCLAPSIGSSLYGDDGSILPMGILIAVIVAIALIIGIIILTLGLILIKRYCSRRLAQSNGTTLAMTSSNLHGHGVRIAKEPQYNSVPHQPLYQSTKPCQYNMQHHQQQQQQQQYNEYLHHQQNLYDFKMKTRPLPGIPQQNSTDNEVMGDQQQMIVDDSVGESHEHEYNQEEFSSIKSDDIESLNGPQYFELEGNGRRAPQCTSGQVSHYEPGRRAVPHLQHHHVALQNAVAVTLPAGIPASSLPPGGVTVTVPATVSSMSIGVPTVPVGISGVPVGVAMPYHPGICASATPLPPPKPPRAFSIPDPPTRVNSPLPEGMCEIGPGVVCIPANGHQRPPFSPVLVERDPSISGNYSW